MTTLQTKGFSDIVGTIAAGMQGRISTNFLNFAKGSVLRALAEAYAGVGLWLQKLALDILRVTRLATSNGDDVDSWLADFGITTRLGAQAATGLVVFGRYTASAATPIIPIGVLVQTQDGLQRFAVYVDPANPLYSAAASGYVMPAQVASVIVPVQAASPGSLGNVAAGAITLLATSVPGVDTVSNPAALTNGFDQELDADVKARFRLDILALSKGTRTAITAAIKGLRVGLQVSIQENVTLDGSPVPGMLTVVVDDGSGSLPDDLLLACRKAVADDDVGVRAAGVRIGIYRASVVYADVVMVIQSASGYYHPNVVAAVEAAVAYNIALGGLGAGLSYFDLSAWARSVPGCAKVLSVTLNGGQTDMPASLATTIKPGSVVIS